MKKKIIISALLIMILSVGVVSAATNWGKFEGFNIVKLVINGKEIKAQDVPAVMLNGRTMVPIYMLREAGLNVKWDGKNYTVDVKSNSSGNSGDAEKLKQYAIISDTYMYVDALYGDIALYLPHIQLINTNKDYIHWGEITTYYIQLLSNYDNIVSHTEEVISYIGENNSYSKELRNALNNYKLALDSLSKSIDYSFEYLETNSSTALKYSERESNNVTYYINQAADITTKQYNEIIDYIYNY